MKCVCALLEEEDSKCGVFKLSQGSLDQGKCVELGFFHWITCGVWSRGVEFALFCFISK